MKVKDTRPTVVAGIGHSEKITQLNHEEISCGWRTLTIKRL